MYTYVSMREGGLGEFPLENFSILVTLGENQLDFLLGEP